jgi:hypothetical protein
MLWDASVSARLSNEKPIFDRAAQFLCRQPYD